MDFSLSKEEEMLRRSARDFLAAECPSDLVREMAIDEKGFPLELWKKMAELGWIGLRIPEEYGGVGGSFLEETVLLEEMGRVCLPGPFFTATVLGSSSIMEAGNESQKRDLLPGISEGNIIVTLALIEAAGSYDPASIKVTATDSIDDFVINGTKLFVPDAHVADYVVCAARTSDGNNDGITLFLVDAHSPGLSHSPLQTLGGSKLSEVVFHDVKVPKSLILGHIDQGRPCLEKVLEKGAVATCALMVGGAQRAMEMAVEHSKIRIQFGRPIGSFQAVQFYCANMLTDIDGARLITYQAACKLSSGVSCTKEVAMAKAWVNGAYRRIIALAHQVIGGGGIMDEYDMSLFSKRALGWRSGFGDTTFHREVIARELGM